MSPRFGSRRPYRPGGARPGGRRPGGPPSDANRSAAAVQTRRENVPIELPARITVKELADLMRVSAADVIKGLLQNGMLVTINQQIDYDTAAIVAHDLGFVPREAKAPTMESTALGAPIQDEAENLVDRPPVVTIMGHVDHG